MSTLPPPPTGSPRGSPEWQAWWKVYTESTRDPSLTAGLLRDPEREARRNKLLDRRERRRRQRKELRPDALRLARLARAYPRFVRRVLYAVLEDVFRSKADAPARVYELRDACHAFIDTLRNPEAPPLAPREAVLPAREEDVLSLLLALERQPEAAAALARILARVRG